MVGKVFTFMCHGDASYMRVQEQVPGNVSTERGKDREIKLQEVEENDHTSFPTKY